MWITSAFWGHSRGTWEGMSCRESQGREILEVASEIVTSLGYTNVRLVLGTSCANHRVELLSRVTTKLRVTRARGDWCPAMQGRVFANHLSEP